MAGGSSAEEAFGKLKGVIANAVVTDGPNGAFVRVSTGRECQLSRRSCASRWT